MILKFIVACHVSTIPKSPPKIIRENTYTGFWESQFFFISVWSELLDCHVATLFAMTANRQCKRQKCHVITSGSEVIQCIVDAVNQRFTTSYQLHLKTLSLTLSVGEGIMNFSTIQPFNFSTNNRQTCNPDQPIKYIFLRNDGKPVIPTNQSNTFTPVMTVNL